MQEHISPEEKLLKLIRHKDRASPKEGEAKKSSGSALKNPAHLARGEKAVNVIKALDKILLIAASVLSLYIGYEFFFTGKDASALIKEPVEIVKDAGDNSAPIVKVTAPKPSEYYTQPAQARDLFDTALSKKTNEIKAGSSVPELTKSLRLVGVILGEVSEAVIEDTESRQTFFLRKGESFKNAVIEEIEESKVIISFGGQRIALEQ